MAGHTCTMMENYGKSLICFMLKLQNTHLILFVNIYLYIESLTEKKGIACRMHWVNLSAQSGSVGCKGDRYNI